MKDSIGTAPAEQPAKKPRRRAGGAVFICGGDFRPGPRDTECPNKLHDYPLPSGYNDAADVAQARLYKRWANVRCPDCGFYGWVPGQPLGKPYGEVSGV